MTKRSWAIGRVGLSLFGVFLFIFILTRVDLAGVFSILTKANPLYLGLAVVINIPVVLLKSWRWQFLLKRQNVEYSLWQTFLAYFSGIFLGLVTPGRVGELAKVYYLTVDKGQSFGKAFSSILIDRMLDVYILFLIGGCGFIIFSLSTENLALSISVLVIILIIPFVFLSKKAGTWLKNLVNRTSILKKFDERVNASIDQFYSGIYMLFDWHLIFPILITFAAYAVFFTQAYLLALSLGLSMSFILLIMSIAVASLAGLIPISIAGIGSRDAILIALFSLEDIGSMSALSYSLLILFTSYICGAVIGAVAWFIKPIRLST